MTVKETNEDRKKRFEAMSSHERKILIKEKMNAQGLKEGSGVPGKDLSSYDRDEIWDLIQVTSCLPEMRTKPPQMPPKADKKTLIPWLLIAIAFACGLVLYYEQYPSPETRREISVNGIFTD